ncbi:sugar phosphate isomerase/epimerase [Thermosulfurimonas marina]|uniref:Sugar phosphate isomerase/epimerase n=1 Tax=Thermosulfurimonas marina TaxID=2047767 RepID=A0A6H1WQW5_9BACT|nr:sugar phosphate isomerase/epimerase family protein [Thermosulfurimonas marina]QJA05558.1 sugar phosphate isomerase/epimerase [Thermosulfurimonas marina]
MKTWAVFVSVPFDLLREKYLSLVLERRLPVEVSLDREALDQFSFQDFAQVAQGLQEAGLPCTVHAPFCDLSPGALDALVRQASLRRLREALRVAALFAPQAVVLHSGYHPGYHREILDRWRNRLYESLEVLLSEAEELGLKILLENVFEPSAEVLRPIFERFPPLGWCFDPGHAYAFARTTWRDWLPVLHPYLGEIHLHDNRGDWDEHLALGKGKIPFPEIFGFLKEKGRLPLLTLEAHREEDVEPGLAYLRGLLGRDPAA